MHVSIVRTSQEAETAYEMLSAAKAIGCDTETTGFEPSSGRLLSIQFSDGNFHALVPVSEGAEPGPLAKLLAGGTPVKVFHNARFDLGFLNSAGLKTRAVFDSMLAEKVLTKGADQSVALSETLYRYFAIDLDKSRRKRFGRNWNGNWTEELVEYAMNDVIHLPQLMREQTGWLRKLGLEREYESLLLRSIGAVTNDGTLDALP